MANLPPREVAANKAHLMSLALEVLRTRDDIDEWDVFQHLTRYLTEHDKQHPDAPSAVKKPATKPFVDQSIDAQSSHSAEQKD